MDAKNTENKKEYKVIGKKIEAPGVTTLQIKPTEGDMPEYRAGQFITVYFPNAGTPEEVIPPPEPR